MHKFILIRYMKRKVRLLRFFVVAAFENRGSLKFGDRCTKTQECGFEGSVCDEIKGLCTCMSEVPVTNHLDKCGKGKELF